MALAARRAKQLPKQPGLAFCYDMLNRVSRRCGACSALQRPAPLCLRLVTCGVRLDAGGAAGYAFAQTLAEAGVAYT